MRIVASECLPKLAKNRVLLGAGVSVGMISSLHNPCVTGSTQEHLACEPQRYTHPTQQWELLTDTQVYLN